MFKERTVLGQITFSNLIQGATGRTYSDI